MVSVVNYTCLIHFIMRYLVLTCVKGASSSFNRWEKLVSQPVGFCGHALLGIKRDLGVI
jgi:hypothetical protein